MQSRFLQTQNASALVLVLISAGVLGAIALLLTNYLRRELAGAGRLQSFLRAGTNVHNLLANDVIGLATQPTDSYLATINENEGVRLQTNGSHNESMLLLGRTYADSGAKRTTNILLSYRNVFPTILPHANWQAFPAADPCRSWISETNFNGSTISTKSTRTCADLDTLSEPSGVLGNVRLSAPLIISNQHNSTLRIFVTGFAEFAQGLYLEQLSDVRIEIIVGGDLSITDIITNSVTNTQLLAHSARGNVEINFSSPNISLCDGGQIAAVSLTVEGQRDIRINGNSRGAHATVGCPIVRDETVWPKFVLLGHS